MGGLYAQRSWGGKLARRRVHAMPAGLSIVLALLAQAASSPPSPPVYGPVAPVATPPAPPAKAAERDCEPKGTDPKSLEIIVCAPKPQGYRIDPDLVEARREKKQGDAGRPHNPHESYAVHDCASVGPMGCRGGPGFNILAAAATAAEAINRLSKGQEIASLFVTDPHQSEYQLYKAAKKRREFIDAEKAAKAKSDNAPAVPGPVP
jgi:hypothetical protein